jgi:cytoskeleton protein RodZ
LFKRLTVSKVFMNFGAKQMPVEPVRHEGPTELGRMLCATRMRVGKDLQRIAQVLHIRYNYLVAIEDGRYEDLPGQAYAIGFVRAYADHLGLDGDEIVRRYKEESAGLKQKSVFEFPVPTSETSMPSGTLLLVAVVAGMVIYGTWYSLAGSDRSAVELIQQVPDRLAAMTAPNAIQAALPVAPLPPGTPAEVSVSRAAEGGEYAPTAALPPVAPPGPPPLAAPPPLALASIPLPPIATTPVVSDVLELRAKADVWITLRDAEAVERTQFLRKDEVLRLPEQGVTTLVTANPGDLDILVNGKALPTIDAGLFAKGVALDPQRLKTTAPAAVTPTVAKPAAAPETPATPPDAPSSAPTVAPPQPASATTPSQH